MTIAATDTKTAREDRDELRRECGPLAPAIVALLPASPTLLALVIDAPAAEIEACVRKLMECGQVAARETWDGKAVFVSRPRPMMIPPVPQATPKTVRRGPVVGRQSKLLIEGEPSRSGRATLRRVA